MRRLTEREARGAGWARAKRALRDVIGREVGAVREIGWVRKIGDGLSRDIFGAEVELAGGRSEAFVVALPRADADPELRARTLRECALIKRLRNYSLPFCLPDVIGVSPEAALVRRYAYGVELDLRAGRQPAVEPWEVVGEIAASIHAIPGEAVEDVLDGTATRDAHARAAIAVFEELDEPEMRDARDWALAHHPLPEQSVLLHGDLLGQNILLAPGRPPTVIDWEYARRGDPAHDLATSPEAQGVRSRLTTGSSACSMPITGTAGARSGPSTSSCTSCVCLPGGVEPAWPSAARLRPTTSWVGSGAFSGERDEPDSH